MFRPASGQRLSSMSMTTARRGCSQQVHDMIVGTGVQTRASISRGDGIVLIGGLLSLLPHRPRKVGKQRDEGDERNVTSSSWLGKHVHAKPVTWLHLLHVTVLLPGILVSTYSFANGPAVSIYIKLESILMQVLLLCTLLFRFLHAPPILSESCSQVTLYVM